ncbi:MAG: DUF5686 family protein, partial [Ginsengibacter sp.]
MHRNFTLFILLLFSYAASAQSHKVFGKIINTKLEPLAFVSVEVKEVSMGSTSREDGTYQLELDEGKYDLVFSIIGYKPQLVTVIIGPNNLEKNIILDVDNAQGLTEVVIKGKDRADEIIRNVIRNKDKVIAAAGAYSCKVYIKAVQENSSQKKKIKNKPAKSTEAADTTNSDLKRMAMAEIALTYDYESPQHTKEERTGVTRGEKADGLFYLSTTEGDFNFYNNLLKVPAVADVPILSPISYSGLLAYKFKTLAVKTEGGKRVFIISVKPRQLSNATVEGEVTIADSSWVILKTQFSFPKYHLPEYDVFEVAQDYSFINNRAWMPVRQQFTYMSKAGKKKVSGRTTATYKDYELNKTFAGKYFGAEVSITTQEAYERDSTFWQTTRTEPLTRKELRFVRYKDSIYTA